MRDFRKIIAWQLSDEFTVAIYRETKSFPREEIYGLTSQIRRAAYSVPANIAEGASRSSVKDYLHFLYVARGSNSEAQYFTHLAHRLQYLSSEDYDRLHTQAQEVGRTLNGLIKSVEKEVGPIRSITAKVTSLLILSLSHLTLKL